MQLDVLNKKGEKLVGILEGNLNSKKLVVICHGAGGSKNGPIQTFLTKNLSDKFAVFRFDFSGNGDSEGFFEEDYYSKEIDDILSVLKYFSKEGYRIKFLLGHSKSGSVVLLGVKKFSPYVDSIVSLCPRIDLFKSSEMVFYNKNSDKINEYGYCFINKEKSQKINKGYVADIRKWKDVSLHYKPEVDTLVIHGGSDGLIDISDSVSFVEDFPEVDFVEIPEGDHCFSGKLPELSEIITNYSQNN